MSELHDDAGLVNSVKLLIKAVVKFEQNMQVN
jgi:hypothetical protein